MGFTIDNTFYLNYFENACDALSILKDGIFVQCNAKTLELFNCTNEQIIGKTPSDFSLVYQSDGELSKEKVKEYFIDRIEGISPKIEWSHCRPDGSVFDAEVTLSKIESNNEIFIVSNIRDISERKRAEQDIKNSEEQLRKILQSVNDAILSANVKGTIISWNYFAEKIFGYSVEEIIGQNLSVLLPNDDVQKYFTRVKEKDKNIGEFDKTIEVSGIHKNGSTIALEVSITKLEISNGLLFTLIIRDISDRKQKELAILQLNDELEKRVIERTAALDLLNEKLSIEINKERHIEERLQTLVSSITDYTYYVTIENNSATKTTHGEGCFAITGYTVDEFTTDSMLWFTIIHRHDQKIVNAKIRRLMKTHDPNSIEIGRAHV